MYVFLQDAVVICTAVPWALCCLLYSGLHVTYPRCGGCRQQAVWGLAAVMKGQGRQLQVVPQGMQLAGMPLLQLHSPICPRHALSCMTAPCPLQ